jgi:hypothetical protein
MIAHQDLLAKAQGMAGTLVGETDAERMEG